MSFNPSTFEGKSASEGPDFTAGQSLRILFVEDSPLDRRMAGMMFERLGYDQVDMASNGAEAVEMALEGGYDVIFMDLQMPVMNGIAATEAIRDSQNLRQPIIIALTGYAAAAVKEECKRAGADDFLAKPAGLEDFQRILTACGKKRSRAAA